MWFGRDLGGREGRGELARRDDGRAALLDARDERALQSKADLVTENVSVFGGGDVSCNSRYAVYSNLIREDLCAAGCTG